MSYPRYPDLLNNPDNDPRVAQEQYEEWKRWDENHEPEQEREPTPPEEEEHG